MTFPKPQPGLVIRYSYLWHAEFLEGREEGVKDRPWRLCFRFHKGNAHDVEIADYH